MCGKGCENDLKVPNSRKLLLPGRQVLQYPRVELRVDVFCPEEVDVVPPLVGDGVVVEQVGQL